MAKPKARAKSSPAGRKQKSAKRPPQSLSKARPRKASGKKSAGRKPAPKRGAAERVQQYFRDVRHELQRTVWPSRQQVITSSIVVLVVLVVFSAYIAVLDFAWLQLIEAITAQF